MPELPGDTAAVVRALAAHRDVLGAVGLGELFANDPGRAASLTFEAEGLVLDLSKQRLTHQTLAHLLSLAAAAGVGGRRAALLAGEAVNTTEARPALHTALRDPRRQGAFAGGRDVLPAVHAVRDRMRALADRVRGGAWQGFSGEPITDVVNLGIGGSDLGPRMAVRALRPAGARPRVHFVSNVDGAHLHDVLVACRPPSTLFIVASKTFTTQETMANAESARAWLRQAGVADAAMGHHFLAVTVNMEAAAAFGIAPASTFAFWDWVGGRFSLWGAIGLPIAIGLGTDAFDALLDGAHQMDRHFAGAPPERNLPLLLALVGLWNRSFLGMPTLAVLPYDQRLEGLVPYLQQLEMESNGKAVALDGQAVRQATCPVVWGAPGTDGQHAFYQLLHQGPSVHPCDFIGALSPAHPLPRHHRLLLANMVAQSAALMRGRSLGEARAELLARGLSAAAAEELAPHRVFPGNRPSTTILLPDLSPGSLGRLLALYEHKVFCQGVLWNINSFDQWGVELGKELGKSVLAAMDDGPTSAAARALDPSSRALAARLAKVG